MNPLAGEKRGADAYREAKAAAITYKPRVLNPLAGEKRGADAYREAKAAAITIDKQL